MFVFQTYRTVMTKKSIFDSKFTGKDVKIIIVLVFTKTNKDNVRNFEEMLRIDSVSFQIKTILSKNL